MEYLSDDEILEPMGLVHCPGGGVCRAGGCSNLSTTEIENNDLSLNFNSGNS
ncbi:MAG: hypothetical protein J6B85_08825 [Lachnospiraceae bacterium]|nr:hypothetical protein [Lachnospiraceae bacterium]